MRYSYQVVCFVILLAANSLYSYAQTSQNRIELEPAKVEMVAANGVGHFSSINLGKLVPGKRYKCILEMLNSSESDFTCTIVQTGCGCSKFSLESQTIAVGDTGKATLTFTLPKGTEMGRFGFRIDFFNGVGNLSGMLNVSAELAGNLYASPVSSPPLSVNSGLMVWKVPLHITPPVHWKKLEVELSESLGRLSARVVKQTDQLGSLEFYMPQVDFEGEYIFGTATVADKTVGAETEVDLTFANRHPVTLTPHFFRFVEKSNVDSPATKSLVASCLIRIEKDFLESSRKSGFKSHPSLVAKIGDVKLASRVSQLSEQIFRVKIQVEDIGAFKKKNNLECEVTFGGQVLRWTRPYSFPEESE